MKKLGVIAVLLVLVIAILAQTALYYANMPISELAQNDASACASNDFNFLCKKTRVGVVKTVEHHFVKFRSETPQWQLMPYYTTDCGACEKNITGSYTYNDTVLNIEIPDIRGDKGKIYATVPADSSRESRLGYFCDFNIVRYKLSSANDYSQACKYIYKAEYISDTLSCEVVYH